MPTHVVHADLDGPLRASDLESKFNEPLAPGRAVQVPPHQCLCNSTIGAHQRAMRSM